MHVLPEKPALLPHLPLVMCSPERLSPLLVKVCYTGATVAYVVPCVLLSGSVKMTGDWNIGTWRVWSNLPCECRQYQLRACQHAI